MSDATGHLPQGPQSFLLQNRLLRLAQIIVCPLQGNVSLRLVSSQCDLLSQLAQELAVPAAEALSFAPCRDQYAKDLALDLQRGRHQRAQSALREPLRKREIHLPDIRLIDEPAPHTTRQAVLVDGNTRVLRHAQFSCERAATPAHAGHQKNRIGRVVGAGGSEVDRQILFERAQCHLQDTCQIQALTDRPGDLPKQIQSGQLHSQLAFGALALGNVSRDP